MATHSNNFVRVRLYFDYPPPAVIDCRMCWLLVDLNTCRVVSDLESIIREKFEFSRGSILSLFIEDCYLPHTESIYVVRDNDSVRVKVDYLAQVNGHGGCPDTASENSRKRQRPAEEDGPGEHGVGVELKKKKRKKMCLERDAKQALVDESTDKSQGKQKEKRKRKEAEVNGPAVTCKPAASTNKIPASVHQPVKSTKKPPVAPARTQNVSSSDSSSEEDAAPKKRAAQKPAPKTPSSTPAASKVPPTTKPRQTKSHPPPSSSSETVSSSDEASSVKSPPKNKPVNSTAPKGRISENSKSQQAPPAQQSTNGAQKQAASVALPPRDKTTEPCDSDGQEEIELVIRRPLQLGRGVGRPSAWGGRGRGKNRRGGPGEFGWGEGRGGIRGHKDGFDFSYNGTKEPSYQTDSLTNMSVVLQNGAESAPKQDYSSMPLLAAPPQVGQKIVFKLLELTENYTPEVSEYKEGKILSFDPTTKQVDLELLNTFQAPVEPGKFDLVYQNPDGSESVEYAVSRSSRVTERWDSLLEPRLII
ncbi:coilin [Micropterus dolomieu]|uniref:coilin n=1 Tax=Micropterus dolomieu TaxID=147949 RepID=UPI001E8CDE7B|nr:coilin [Micropterus dolomieu]